MNRFGKIICGALFLMFVFSMFPGCGGSNGGTGRRVEEGELVPFNPFTDTISSPGTTSLDSQIENSWTLYSIGEYVNAASAFTALVNRSDLSSTQRVDSLLGQGMSLFRSQGADQAITPLNEAVSLAPTNFDAKVALAAALIQSNSGRDIPRAVTLLEEVGLANTAFVYTQERHIGISNAEAHAQLALAYFLRNSGTDRDLAKSQIQAAKAADATGDSSVAQIEQSLIVLNGGPL